MFFLKLFFNSYAVNLFFFKKDEYSASLYKCTEATEMKMYKSSNACKMLDLSLGHTVQLLANRASDFCQKGMCRDLVLHANVTQIVAPQTRT